MQGHLEQLVKFVYSINPCQQQREGNEISLLKKKIPKLGEKISILCMYKTEIKKNKCTETRNKK